jgi:hypothetical protein
MFLVLFRGRDEGEISFARWWQNQAFFSGFLEKKTNSGQIS